MGHPVSRIMQNKSIYEKRIIREAKPKKGKKDQKERGEG